MESDCMKIEKVTQGATTRNVREVGADDEDFGSVLEYRLHLPPNIRLLMVSIVYSDHCFSSKKSEHSSSSIYVLRPFSARKIKRYIYII
jgi:hypothetical protein